MTEERSGRIFLSSPDVGETEERFVVAAMRSGWIAPLGPDVTAFEEELADRVGVAHAVALSSGTAALHLGLLGLGVAPGDVVVTASMTFAATANAIVYTGAEPYFVDCDIGTGNLDPDLLRETLYNLRAHGDRVTAVVPVDLLGKVANYSEICGVADEFGIPVLADAAESLGAYRHGKPAGSFGRASAVSFNGNKVMTTSGGGMLLTNEEYLASRARYLATQARQPVLHYEHIDIGYNYRLSNLLAALGRGQLSRLDEMIRRRRAIRNMYRDLFDGVPGVQIFGGAEDSEDNCWLTSILVDREVASWSAEDLRTFLDIEGIESRLLWKPMHLQPVFARSRSAINGASQKLFEQGLSLPSGSGLNADQLGKVSGRIKQFLFTGPQ